MLQRICHRTFFTFPCVLFLAGCAGDTPFDIPSDPSAYPYVFEEQSRDGSASAQKSMAFADLDNDGIDERIIVSFGVSAMDNLLYVETLDREHLYQERFGEKRIESLHFTLAADVTNDGRKELFLQVDERDSLCIVVVDIYNRRRVKKIAAYRYPAGVEAARGEVSIDILDVVRDGKRDLVLCAIVHAGDRFGYRPHGLSAFDMGTGGLAWHFPTVSWPAKSIVADVDHDGTSEILLTTDGTGSGPDSGDGLLNTVSYLFVLKPNGEHAARRIILGHRSNGRILAVGDLDHAGSLDAVCLVGNRDVRRIQTRIVELSLEHGDTIRSLDLPVTMADADRRIAFEADGTTVFMVPGIDGQLYLVDDTLGVVRSARVNGSISLGRAVDVVGDGRKEIVLTVGNARILVLDDKFEPVALVDGATNIVVGRNRQRAAAAVLGFHSDGRITSGVLRQNPGYFLNRVTAFGLTALLGLALASGGAYLVFRGIFYAKLLGIVTGRSEGRGILVINRKGKIRRIDAGFRRLTGVAEKNAGGVPWMQVIDGEKLAPARRLIGESVGSRSAREASMPVLADDSPGEMHLAAAPIIWKGLYMGHVVIADDLTQKLKTDRAVNWTMVARNLAHEMKTPLSTIWFSLERLRQIGAAGGGDRGEDVLKSIEEEIRRLDGYIKGFMKLANLNPPSLQRTSLNGAVGDLLDSFGRSLPESVRVEKHLEPEDPEVMMDVNLFTAALRNILDNAVESMCGKGVLRVSTYLVRDLSTSGACVAIADTGRGIRKEDIPKVFTPYFSRSGGGTGLGLLITRKIVDEHGGGITFTSAEGLGTEFTIRLPLASGQPGGRHA